MHSKRGKLAQHKINVTHFLWKIPRENWAACSVPAEAFALWLIDFGISSKGLVFSLWYNECCKAKHEGGGCTPAKLDYTKEHEASFTIVQKNYCAYLSFCTSLYAALNAAFCILPWKERGSGFEGNQCLWFLWGMSLIFLLAFLQTISLPP